MSLAKLRRRVTGLVERGGGRVDSFPPDLPHASQAEPNAEGANPPPSSSVSEALGWLSIDGTSRQSPDSMTDESTSASAAQVVAQTPREESAPTLLPHDALPPYKYEAVSEGEIRLVTILPAVKSGEPIKCLLTRYERAENPGYAAISYTWGDRALVATITCNGRSLKVTRNCEAALRVLRLPDSPQTVWMDLLSIDQSNVPERNVQVTQMGEIFRKARETFVCLGHSEKRWDIFDSDTTDEMWTSLLDHAWFQRTWVIQEVLFSAQITVVIGESKILWDDFISLFLARNLKLPYLMSIRNDLAHEYGMRPSKSWDLHSESSLDSGDCNEDEDDDVLRALNLANSISNPSDSYNPELPRGIRNESKTARFSAATSSSLAHPRDGPEASREQESDLYEVTTQNSIKEEQTSSSKDRGHLSLSHWMLLEVMESTRSFQCHDPRDKLFAILPLFKDQPPERLRVDYMKPAEQVYADLSYFLLQQDLPDCLINTVGVANLDRPSWIIDWNEPPPRNALKGVYESAYRAGFQNTGREIRVARPVENGIKLRGLIVSTIRQLSYQHAYSIVWNMQGRVSTANLLLTALGVYTEGAGYSATLSGQLEWQPSAVDDPSSLYTVRNLLISEIVRATQNIDPTAKQVPPNDLEAGRDFSIHMDTFNHALFALDIAKDMLQERAMGFPQGGGPSQDSWDHHSSLSFQGGRDYIMQGRCYVTKQLDYVANASELCGIGLVPKTAAVDDYICILLGFKVPFVMRRFGDYWKLVGECYFFRGIMFGGLVDNLQWDNVWSHTADPKLEDFIIV